MNKKFGVQNRFIHDPDDPGSTIIPTMPLLVILDNGKIGEARTIRGAVSLVIGNEYFDAEESIVEWHMRVETARKYSMKALSSDIESVVYDSKQGVISNNFAAAPGDPDYASDDDTVMSMPIKILVDNDRLFLLSLVKLGFLRILERQDSHLVIPHSSQGNEYRRPQNCCGCLYWDEGEDNSGDAACPVYNQSVRPEGGAACNSFAFPHEGSAMEYTGGTYVDISQEYNLDSIIAFYESR